MAGIIRFEHYLEYSQEQLLAQKILPTVRAASKILDPIARSQIHNLDYFTIVANCNDKQCLSISGNAQLSGDFPALSFDLMRVSSQDASNDSKLTFTAQLKWKSPKHLRVIYDQFATCYSSVDTYLADNSMNMQLPFAYSVLGESEYKVLTGAQELPTISCN